MRKHSTGNCQSLVSSPRLARGCDYLEKGWCSERIPHAFGSNDCTSRRKQLSTQTSPLCNGRQLPSKWEDAERWICSPVLGYGSVAKNAYLQPPSQNTQQESQRRPKSKSGPILPPAVPSSAAPFDFGIDPNASVRNVLMDGASSPLATGVFMPFGGAGFGGANMPTFSEMITCSSFPSSRDERSDGITGEENSASRAISRRDMATQMSPRSSPDSSHEMRSPSPPLSLFSIVEAKKDHDAKVEVREVRVDNRATLLSLSGNHGSCSVAKARRDIDQPCGNAIDCCSWETSEAASEFAKLRREEAKIAAWENLQKAKAEAAIRKLEMKLEKKRSSSMDKILKRLRTAQIKAKEMRTSITTTEDDQKPKMLIPITCVQKHSRFCLLYSCFSRKAI